LSASVKIVTHFDRVKKSVNDSIYRSFSHASASIRSMARKSILRRVGDEPSPIGMPPRTRRGQLRNSILYDVNKKREEAIIGATSSKMGPDGARVHEHGGVRGTNSFEPRPFMQPALEKAAKRFPAIWKYSVK